MNNEPSKNLSNLTEEDMKKIVDRAKNDKVSSMSFASGIHSTISRNFIVVGTGDGGCNIAQAIKNVCPDTFFVAYNTSTRGMTRLNPDMVIAPDEEDGSGKVRSYSKEVFCNSNGYAEQLLKGIAMLAEQVQNLEYILVTTTADGGTGGGVSPMIAKFLNDNMDVPVIIMGVYPALSEDATAQFNALQWQSEIEKTECPYIILDNNDPSNPAKLLVHKKINDEAAQAIKILSGAMFGPTNISAIDNRDMYMLLKHIGGRICVYGKQGRPVVGQTLDDFIDTMITQSSMPAPLGVDGIGLFLKGPEDFVRNADTTFSQLATKYGNAAVRYFHLEIAEDPYVGVVMTGVDEPGDRLWLMKQRYDEIMNNVKKTGSSIGDIMADMGNPLGKVSKKIAPSDMDMSALNFFKD